MQNAKRFFSRSAFVQAVKEIKVKYCPNGDMCEVIVMFGFMFGTLYLAMLPII